MPQGQEKLPNLILTIPHTLQTKSTPYKGNKSLMSGNTSCIETLDTYSTTFISFSHIPAVGTAIRDV